MLLPKSVQGKELRGGLDTREQLRERPVQYICAVYSGILSQLARDDLEGSSKCIDDELLLPKNRPERPQTCEDMEMR